MQKFESIKEKYKCFNIPDEDMQEIYDNEKDILEGLISYFKKNRPNDFNVVLEYISSLDLSNYVNSKIIKICEFIEALGYELNSEKINMILSNKDISKYFKTITAKEEEVTEKKLERMSCANISFDLIYRFYCKKNNIKIKDDIMQSNLITYDLNVIGKIVKLKIIIKLLKLFPKKDFNLFINYAHINIAEKTLVPHKKEEVSDKVKRYVMYIENDLRYMYNLYFKYQNLPEEECFNSILNDMQKVSLRFRYSNKTYREIKEAIKTLSKEQIIELAKVYGETFLNIKIKESPNYKVIINALDLRLNKEQFLSQFQSDYIRELVKKYGYNNVLKAIYSLTEKQKDTYISIFGEELKENNKNIKKNANYYNGKKNIEEVLNDPEKLKELETLDMSIFEYKNRWVREMVQKYGIELFSKEFNSLSLVRHRVVALKCGENLKEDNEFPKPPSDKCANYYHITFTNAKMVIEQNILKFIEEQKKLETLGELAIYKSPYIRELVKNYGYNNVLKAIYSLPEKQKDAYISIYGEELTENNENIKKNANYYYGKEKIEKILNDHDKLFAYESDYIKGLVKNHKIENVFKALNYLPKKQKDAFTSAYGENLTEDNENLERNSSYYCAIENIKFLLENIENLEEIDITLLEYENKEVRKLIETYGLEKVLSEVENLLKDEREAYLYKNGKTLKENNNFMSASNPYKLSKIYEYASINIRNRLSAKNKNDTTEVPDIDNYKSDYIKDLVQIYGIEKVLKAVATLTDAQKQVVAIIYGKDLTENNSLTSNMPAKDKDYYNTCLLRAQKNIKKNLSNKVVKEEPIHKSPYITDLVDRYGHDTVLKVIYSLPEKQKDAFTSVYGENLTENNNKKNANYYLGKKNLEKVLNDPEKLKELETLDMTIFEYKNKWVREMVQKYGIELFSKEFNSLSLTRHRVVELKCGENLKEDNEFPKPPSGKCKNYYCSIFQAARNTIIKHLEELENKGEENIILETLDAQTNIDNLEKINEIEEKTNFEENFKETEEIPVNESIHKSPYITDLVDRYGHDTVLKVIYSLSEKQKDAFTSVYGENLTENNKNIKKNANYYLGKKNLEKVLNDAEKLKELENLDMTIFEYKNKWVREMVQKYGIELFSKEFNSLSLTRHRVVELKCGENLKEDNEFPKPPSGKCKNYYCSIFQAARNTIIKHLEELENKGEENIILETLHAQTNIDNLEKINEIEEKTNFEENFKETEEIPVNESIYKSPYIRDLVDRYGYENVKQAVDNLPKNELELFILMHGEALVEDNSYDNIYKTAQKDIEEFLKNLNTFKAEMIELKEEVKEIKKSSKKRHKKQKKYIQAKNNLESIKALNTENKNKKQNRLEKMKETLETIKVRSTENKDKIINKFKSIIPEETLEELINNLNSNDLFYLESQIMLYIANFYNKNPDSEKALEILEFLEETYGKQLKLRFTSTELGKCLISDGLVSSAIDDAITNYDGNKTFIVALNLSLRKLK